MKKTYYILAIDYGSGYGVEFGAYDRADVKEELLFQEDNDDYFLKSMRIIKTIDNQNAINAAINKLNKKGYIRWMK